MKKIYLLALLVLSALPALAQSTGYYTVFGGDYLDETKDMVQLPDGSMLILASSESTSGDRSNPLGRSDAWLIKLNSSGQMIWEKSYGGTFDDYPNSIKKTNDNGFVISGYSNSSDGHITHLHLEHDSFQGFPITITNDEFWILKLDNSGNVQWSKTYGGFSNDQAHSIIQTQDNGYLVVGTTISANDGDVSGVHGPTTLYNSKPEDVWVLKLDVNGDLEWSKTFGGSLGEFGVDVVQTPDLGYVIGANSRSRNGDVTGNIKHTDTSYSDYWVIKIDQNGSIVWDKSFGGTNTEEIVGMAVLNDGTIAIAGNSYSDDGDLPSDSDPIHFWVIGMAANGNGTVNWNHLYGGEGSDILGSITPTQDGGFILGASSFSPWPSLSRGWPGFSNGDGWLVKVDANLETEWDKSLGGNDYDKIIGVVQTSTGSYWAIGTTQSNDAHAAGNRGHTDVLLVEVSAVSISRTSAYFCAGNNYVFPSRFHPDSLITYPGKYFQTIKMNGYDSTIVLTLNVQEMDFDGISASGNTLVADESNASYVWINCANKQALPNETGKTFAPTQTGNYAVLVTKNGCSDTSSCMQVQLTGIDDLTGTQIYAYPNPAANVLKLQNTEEGQGVVLDLLGKQVMQFTTEQGSSQVDLTRIRNGYYFVHLTDNEGHRTVLKVLVNR